MNYAAVLSIKIASGMVYALIGHTLGLWCKSLGYTLDYVTFIGVIFSVPYAIKFLLCSMVLRVFNVSFNLLFWLFAAQYALLINLTFITPGTLVFFGSIMIIASCNAIFDSFVTGQIRAQNTDSDAKTLSTYFYAGELIGMIVGNNIALFMSDYFEWYIVYRVIGLIGFALDFAIFTLKIVPQESGKLTLAASEFFCRLKGSGFYIILVIFLFRIQGAFLSQVPSLFMLEHLSKSELSIIKFCGYIGMALGIWCARRMYQGTGAMVSILILKCLPVIPFIYMAAYNYASVYLGIGVWILEKIVRSLDRIFIVTLQMMHSSAQHATIQWTMMDALGQFARSSGEMISGRLVMILGWYYYFVMCFFVNIIILGILYAIRNKITNPK